MARLCQVCKLPADVQLEVLRQHRLEVPLRSIAEGLRSLGHPVHRDTVWRHCRDHVVAETEYGEEGSEAPAALAVAATVAGVLDGWSRLRAECAAGLRAGGLLAAADVLVADDPETMRKALAVSLGTPAAELLEGRLLAQALRGCFRSGEYRDFAAALASALRDLGAVDLAEAVATYVTVQSPAHELKEKP